MKPKKVKMNAIKAAIVAALTCVFVFALPALAFASEEKSGVAVILPDMNEFIPMLIAFIILVIILAKFGWPVLNNIITTRDETVKEALKRSEDLRAESERLVEEHKEQLADAKSQATKIIADAKVTGEGVKAGIEAKAQADAEAMIEKAKATIDTERKLAYTELQSSAVDLSLSVAARLIGEDLSDDEHRKIIERYVAEAGSLNAN